MYTVFTRSWYKSDGITPNCNGRKTYVIEFDTESEARDYCQENNRDRPKHWLKTSRKYEFTAGGI